MSRLGQRVRILQPGGRSLGALAHTDAPGDHGPLTEVPASAGNMEPADDPGQCLDGHRKPGPHASDRVGIAGLRKPDPSQATINTGGGRPRHRGGLHRGARYAGRCSVLSAAQRTKTSLFPILACLDPATLFPLSGRPVSCVELDRRDGLGPAA